MPVIRRARISIRAADLDTACRSGSLDRSWVIRRTFRPAFASPWRIEQTNVALLKLLEEPRGRVLF